MKALLSGRFAPAVCVLVLTLPGAARQASADIEVGQPLPELSLKTAEDRPLAVRVEQGRLGVTHGGARHQPKALVVHFFQPDCPQCQAQMQALQKTQEQSGDKGTMTIGIAHRGDAKAVRDMAGRLKITFPLAVGTGADAIKTLAAGDAMAIADAGGVIRFAQVGYGGGDEAVWRENLDLLAAGKPVKAETVERGRLKPGDPIFAITFDSVQAAKPVSLSGEGGRLTFRDEKGATTHPKAAVGFFSRY